jgi:HSP20 family protein
MTLVRWSPWDAALSRRPWFDHLVNGFLNEAAAMRPEGAAWFPPVDVRETKDAYVLSAEMPGLTREDVKLTFNQGVLTLEGEKQAEARNGEEQGNGNYYQVERRYGRFSRSFRLPAGIQADKVRADYKDGVLTITVPKAEAAKPKTIEISM